MSAAEKALEGLQVRVTGLALAAVRGGLARVEAELLATRGCLLYTAHDRAGDLVATIAAAGLKKPRVVMVLQRFYLNELPPEGEAALRAAVQEVGRAMRTTSGGRPPG